MLYFILWVIFLLFVILAIPVTSMLENRKYRAAKTGRSKNDKVADDQPADEAFTDDDSTEMADAAGDDFGAFADSTPAGGDDFSAFEEEFK